MARLIVSKFKKKNFITHQGDLKAILQMGRLVSLLPPTPIDMTLRENISSTTVSTPHPLLKRNTEARGEATS